MILSDRVVIHTGSHCTMSPCQACVSLHTWNWRFLGLSSLLIEFWVVPSLYTAEKSSDIVDIVIFLFLFCFYILFKNCYIKQKKIYYLQLKATILYNDLSYSYIVQKQAKLGINCKGQGCWYGMLKVQNKYKQFFTQQGECHVADKLLGLENNVASKVRMQRYTAGTEIRGFGVGPVYDMEMGTRRYLDQFI